MMGPIIRDTRFARTAIVNRSCWLLIFVAQVIRISCLIVNLYVAPVSLTIPLASPFQHFASVPYLISAM
uniref:Uncharacterized protein MANES_10G099000 n=1 Tax=Rhizophora mucronata TaxID=61149 RepID=A0A2P2LCT8_RHIMU